MERLDEKALEWLMWLARVEDNTLRVRKEDAEAEAHRIANPTRRPRRMRRAS